MGLFDTIMSDTVGVVYRAASGKVDPWTKNEIVQNAVSDCVKAGGDPNDCQQQQQQTVDTTLATSNVSWWQATKDIFNNPDDGSGCSITNIKGCVPLPDIDLSWVPYALAGLGVIALLWVLRPYVVAVEE